MSTLGHRRRLQQLYISKPPTRKTRFAVREHCIEIFLRLPAHASTYHYNLVAPGRKGDLRLPSEAYQRRRDALAEGEERLGGYSIGPVPMA